MFERMSRTENRCIDNEHERCVSGFSLAWRGLIQLKEPYVVMEFAGEV
jgi:hypothetical protein